MKKSLKILITILIVFCLFAFICGIVDIKRVKNKKEPIFSINKSGGSGILYIGPGYVIEGAWDDIPGGLEHSKIHTWIWYRIQNI